MFGHDWKPAEATIIAVRVLPGRHRGREDDRVPHEYVVDVRPLGRAPFRATFHEPLMHGHHPRVRPGDVVRVLVELTSNRVKLAPEQPAPAAGQSRSSTAGPVRLE